jgi:hypothetical protein
MTFTLGLLTGLILGAGITLAAMQALCVWMASRDDDRIKEHDAMIRPDDNPLRRLAALIERLGKAVNDGKEGK